MGRENAQTWTPRTLLDIEDKIILVTDEPEMGKSTILTHLVKQTRENVDSKGQYQQLHKDSK